MSDPVAIYGIDFTSAPIRTKPITALECKLVEDVVEAVEMHLWESFDDFEQFLDGPPSGPPWIVSIDFPFGMPCRFIKNLGWPANWADYVAQNVKQLASRQAWRDKLDDYKRDRKRGDKEHRRLTDAAAGSVSPQKQYGVPVALMFFEGAPRLRAADVLIPGLRDGPLDRVVVEGYPGVAARSLIGRISYKAESPSRQTEAQRQARKLIPDRLSGDKGYGIYGIHVRNPRNLDFVTDPAGDHLDALLCAVQAAWAWRNGPPNFGLPRPICATEGWIADPNVIGPTC